MKLEFHYNGLDVDRGRMNAVDLGPAIFGIGKSLGGASRVLYGDDTRLRVEVQADFEHASFGVTVFAVAVDGGIIGHLTTDQITLIVAVLGFTIKDGILGVLGLIRKQAGRKIASAEQAGDTVNVIFEGDTTITNITVNEYKVFVDPEMRSAFRGMVAPLTRDGIDSLKVQIEKQEAVTISKSEAPLFDAPALNDEISCDIGRAVLEVISPVFRDGNSWKFAQGDSSYWAKIVDPDFLADVSKHRKTFGRGDALVVDLEVRVLRVEGKLKYERRIIKVHKHEPGEGGGGQIPLI